jgi:hypothetical protein
MSTPSFAVNERVLCYHGPLIYEAKVLKCEIWDETNTKLDTVGSHYLVHYKGWKQTCVSDPALARLSDSRFSFTAGTSGSPRRVSSNSTRSTSPFKRTFPGLRLPPLRPVPLPRKHPRLFVAHKQEEGDVKRAGAALKGGGKTTMGQEGRRCGWPCQTR